MPDVRALLADPDFRALPKPEQIKGLTEFDPDFGALPYEQQVKALGDNSVPVAQAPGYNPLKALQRFGQEIVSPAGVETAGQALQAPLLRPSLLLPSKAELEGTPGGVRLPLDLLRGATEIAEGMTSPVNALLLLGLGGLGQLAKAPSAYARTGARLLDVGLDAYFAGSAGKALLESSPRIAEAWQKRDYPSLMELMGQDLVHGLFGTYFGVRGGRKGIELARTGKAAYQYVKGQRPGEPVVVNVAGEIPPPAGPAPGQRGRSAEGQAARLPAAAAAPEGAIPNQIGKLPEPPAGPAPSAPPRPGMPAMTQRQSAAIWARKAELGLQEAPFRAILQNISGQDKTENLTGPQASQVIDALGNLQPPAAKPAPAGSTWLDRAAEFARSKDRVNITALEKHFGIPRAQARQLHGQLVHSGVIDRLGKVIQAQQKLVLPEAPEESPAVAQGAPPAGAEAPAGGQPPAEAAPAQPAAPQPPQPTLYERAEALAREEGKITKLGLKNAFKLRQKQADDLMEQLIAKKVVNSIGRVKQEPKATPPPKQRLPIVPPGGAPPAAPPPAAPPFTPPAQQPLPSAAAPEGAFEAPPPDDIPEPRRGATEEVVTPAGTKAQAQWVVLDLASDSVITSHNLVGNENPDYPQQLQNRDRSRLASEAQIRSIAANPDAKRLSRSYLVSEGAPAYVNLEGKRIVASGNGRTEGIRLAYKQGTATGYRAGLAQELQSLGLDPKQIEGMQQPALFRALTGKMDLERLARESNAPSAAARSAAEVARGDAKRLTGALMETFKPGEDGRIVSTENWPFVQTFFRELVTESERGQYQLADGSISQAGINRIRNAVFAKAYGESAAVEKLAEDPDDNVRNITAAMLRAAPSFAGLEEAIAGGQRHNLNIASDVAAAAAKLSHLREQGTRIEDYLNQEELFAPELSPEARDVLRVFGLHGRSAARLGEILSAYTDTVESLGSPQQQSLISGTIPTKAEILESAVHTVEARQKALAEARKAKKDVQEQALQDAARGGREARPDDAGARPPEGAAPQAPAPEGQQAKLGPDRNLFSDDAGTFDPAAFQRAARVGAEKIRAGFDKFSTWSREMLSQFGQGIKRYLLRIWRSAQKLHARYRRSKAGSERGSMSLFGEAEQTGVSTSTKVDRAKLEAERLSAEFASPLTRQNLRRKLKPGLKPQQGDLFGGMPEAPKQGGLFGEERGSFSLRPKTAQPTPPARSAELQKLYDSPVRQRGIAASSEMQVKKYLEDLRALVAKRLPDRLPLVDEAIQAVDDGSFWVATDAAEGALGYLHMDERAERDWSQNLQDAVSRDLPEALGRDERQTARILGSERGSFSLRGIRRPADEYGEYVPQRKTSAWGDILDVLRPAGVVVERQGGAGKALMYYVREAADSGDVEAGRRLEKLQDSGVTKLSKEDRIQLLDILEGRRSGSPELRRIAMQVRALTDEIGGEAENLGVEISAGGRKVPFVRLANYFPHVIRSVQQLGQNKALRKDVLDNLVRLGIKPDLVQAQAFLDEYLAWVDKGGRTDNLIQYLIDTGQAENRLGAIRLLNRARKDKTLKHGSLEFAREIDLPFYDPDPARVLPHWIAAASERLESIRVFGPKGAEGDLVQGLINEIHEAGGDAQFVQKAVDRMLGKVDDLNKWQRGMAIIRTVQGFKLGLAAIPNASQGALNSLLYGDLQSVGAGFKGILAKEGQRFGMRSGASIDSVLNEMTREVGTDWHPLGVYLKAVGFTATERLNRIFAANAGASYAGRLAGRLRVNPNDNTTRARIEELGIDPDQVQGGQLTGDQILMAAKKFSDITQFRSRPQDLFWYASSPEGKLFFQFKTFIYNQARLVGRTTWGELKSGNYGRATRNFLILATVFPLTGEAIGALRRLVTGREREKDQSAWERYWDAMGEVGALGILGDIFESVKYGGTLKWAAGPGPGQIAEIGDAALRIPQAKDPWKAAGTFGKTLLKQLPLAGQLRRRIMPGTFGEKKKSTLSPELRRLLAAGATP